MISGADGDDLKAGIVPPTKEEAEELATFLDMHPDFRVLRRFEGLDPDGPAPAEDAPVRWAAFLDVETTGLESTAKITELAIQLFRFTHEGEVVGYGPSGSWLNDPGIPISPEITRITGISNEMVAGHSIDLAAMRELLSDCSLIVAHNAEYDRGVVERELGEPFVLLPWACSQREIPWADHGMRDRRLASLLMDLRQEFYSAHRALDDAVVGVAILAEWLGNRTALSHLLESARRGMVRCWAFDSEFVMKDQLKARGYHWHDGSTGAPKCWWRDVPIEDAPEEHRILRRDFNARPKLQRITARDRYSRRALELNPLKEVRDG